MHPFFANFQKKRILHPTSLQIHPDSKSCQKGHILKNKTCYQFSWHIFGEKLQWYCPSQKRISFHINQFQYLFDAITDIFPPVFSSNLKYIFTYKKFWNTYLYKTHEKYNQKEGIYIYGKKESKDFKGDHIFRCNVEVYISYVYVCDGKKDCPGETAVDEVGCECNSTLINMKQCKLMKISSSIKVCSNFYFKDHDGTCKQYDFTFFTSKWSHVLMNDIANHYSKQEVEEITKYKPQLSCQPTYDFSNSFYEISDICSYKLNEHGYLLPCNKGQHLQNCEMFECNIMFKCPKYYCIPWAYICDGKWDCPGGYDESNLHQCRNRTCVNMFKCKMSSTCLHLGDVCNGLVDCPYEDDEYSCLLKYVTCPEICQCLGFAIMCSATYISEYILPIYFPYSFVKILNCTVSAKSKLQNPFQNITFISITSTNLQNICPFASLMKHVMLFDASKNDIRVVQHNCFKNKVFLKVVKLNNNFLQHIQKSAFYHLISLIYIDLSNNMLTVIPEDFIMSSNNLSFLSLENNSLDAKSSKNSLLRLNVIFFTTTQISLCCLTSENVKCSTKMPWFMSCAHLLLNWPLQLTFYFITLVILVTNALSILLIKYGKRKDNIRSKSDTTGVFNIIVTSITVVDITSTIPLIILSGSDLYFRNDFVFIADQWKSSIMCYISSGLSINFVVMAAFLQILLSYVRYIVVKKPFDTTFKSNEFISKVISVGFFSSMFIASLIPTLFWLIYGRLPNIYCSPFIDPSKTFALVEILTFFIISIHLFAFSFNFVIHIKLIMRASKSEGKEVRTNANKSLSKPLMIQIICITCSHFLCWIPDMILHFSIYILDIYPMEVILWKFICISPLNSILIPIIFVLKILRS